MGAFVLGILVGWLAEWLFFTFWVKGGKNSDCSSIKAELEERKREINRLQSRLNEATATASSAAAKSGDSANTKAESASTNVSTSSSTTSSTKKSSASSETTAKKSATKAAPKKAAPKTAAPKKATSKAAPKKATTKKTSNKKAETKKSAPKKSTAKSKAGGDDFTKLSGIGPSMAATLKSLGIDSFSKLAATDDDILRDMLEESGARLNNNKEAMDTWNEQATLAAKGDFEGLKKMQEALKK